MASCKAWTTQRANLVWDGLVTLCVLIVLVWTGAFLLEWLGGNGDDQS